MLSLIFSRVSFFASLATSSFLVRCTCWYCLFSRKEMDTLPFRRAWSVFLSDDDKISLMPMTRAWVSPSRLKAIISVNSALVMTSCLPAHRVSKRVPFKFSLCQICALRVVGFLEDVFQRALQYQCYRGSVFLFCFCIFFCHYCCSSHKVVWILLNGSDIPCCNVGICVAFIACTCSNS